MSSEQRAVFNTLGDRVKAVEEAFSASVPARNYVMLRLDGRAFHSLSKGLKKPFDLRLMDAMDTAALRLCEDISGARAAYVQSDEITVLAADWRHTQNEIKDQQHWFGGSQQKMVSVSASLATAHFNPALVSALDEREIPSSLPAMFDSRVLAFTGDDDGRTAALDAFRWRWMDCVKNSVSMAAHHVFGHKRLLNVGTDAKKQMLKESHSPWESLPEGFRFGRLITREPRTETVSYLDKRDNQQHSTEVLRRPFIVKPASEETFFAELDSVVPQPYVQEGR